jgi:hypothetical protein
MIPEERSSLPADDRLPSPVVPSENKKEVVRPKKEISLEGLRKTLEESLKKPPQNSERKE